MKKLLLSFGAGLGMFFILAATQPTSNIPISGLPIATNAQESAYFPMIQPAPGKTTQDTFRVATSNLFKGRGTVSATNGYFTNLYTSNFFTTNYITSNLYTTNITIGGWQLIITNAVATGTPSSSTNAMWVDTITSQSWVWDQTTLTWIAINPSLSTGIFAFPSVVELRQVHDNGVLALATTWGNLVAADGQGRHYFWSASDTNADDGISVIDLNEHTSG